MRNESQTLWFYGEVGHTQDAKKQLLNLVTFESSESVFDTPKPVQLMDRLLELTTKPDEPALIVDFFAGSGAMGDAVLQKNAADGGNRRFLLVQLPEPMKDTNIASVAALTRARVRAAADELAGDASIAGGAEPGFRACELTSAALAPSTRRDTDENGFEGLFADPIDPDRDDEALLVELLLARGFELTEPAKWHEIQGTTFAEVADGALLACFSRQLSLELFEALIDRDPAQLILLEAGFGGNDEVKINALQHLKTVNAHRDTPIELLVI